MLIIDMNQLSLEKILKLLKKYNINFVDFDFVKDEDFFDKTKYPLVLKVASEDIIHKSEVGGVIVGIKNKEDALKHFEILKKKSKKIISQKMIFGKEVIIGVKKDPQFGNVVIFGLGGIFVEVMKDVSFRVCPITKKDALDMIKEIKSYKILEGIRGEKGVNIEKLADIILKISELASKEKINEIDLNPIMVNENDAVVVDARFLI
jgi:acetate---CoA ligase (ADP-forming) subunit beta